MEHKIRIERITEADLPALAPLTAAFRVTLKSYKGVVAKPDEGAAAEELREYFEAGWPVFTVRLDGSLCGYLVCRTEGPCVWVESLYVLPEYRRQGVASALFRRAEAFAAERGGGHRLQLRPPQQRRGHRLPAFHGLFRSESHRDPQAL